MRRAGEQAEQSSVSGSEGSPGRERVPRSSVSPLLNHLLDCDEGRGGERSGDAGGEPLPSADDILRAEAIRARLDGEVESAEEWYRQAGILSRWDETNIAKHEAQPHAELKYYNGRERRHLNNRLMRADMLEDDGLD